jgi:hypothetical protein
VEFIGELLLLFLFFEVLILFCAVALIAFGIYGGSLLALIKYLAIALGAAIIVTIVYPYIRGVRKGDKILVDGAMAIGFNGIALDNGRIGAVIRVELLNKEVVFCEIESYEGFLSFARAKLLAGEKIKVS